MCVYVVCYEVFNVWGAAVCVSRVAMRVASLPPLRGKSLAKLFLNAVLTSTQKQYQLIMRK